MIDFNDAFNKGLELYPDWETNKSSRYALRGFLYGYGVPKNQLPEGLRYKNVNRHYTTDFYQGMGDATRIKSEESKAKLQEAVNKQNESFKSFLTDFQKSLTEPESSVEQPAQSPVKNSSTDDERWKTPNVSYSELRSKFGTLKPGQVYALLPDGTWGVMDANDAARQPVLAGYTYDGGDFVSGRKALDTMYDSYLSGIQAAQQYAENEMRNEQASARVRGVDYAITPERLEARVKAYLPQFVDKGVESEINNMMIALGKPVGYSDTVSVSPSILGNDVPREIGSYL